jgi:branched-subunit amino acid ABC-type transport system permease component
MRGSDDGFSQLAITGLLTGGLYAMVARPSSGLQVHHVVSLAHGQFLAFGAFFFYVFIVVLALPFWAAILLTFLVAGPSAWPRNASPLRP